ncbi:MAG: hypothetical protein R2783_01095 [Gelidibacter sp.]
MLINLIFEIACICAGILLAITTLDRLDGKSNFFNNIAAKLKPFNAVIGLATLVIGVLYLLRIECIIFGSVGIAAGLLLLPQQLTKIPGIGNSLLKVSNWLLPYRVIVGDIALIIGILGLLNMNPFC